MTTDTLIPFIIGIVVTIGIIFAAIRLRPTFMKARQQANQRIASTGQAVGGGAQSLYLEELTKLANRYHLVGDKAPLTELYVEPRFLTADPPIDLENINEPITNVFHVVPRTYDFPALYSAYNLPTLSLIDLQSGDRHLALLGKPGVGKSTALALLTLYAARRIDLQNMDTMLAEAIAEEDKELTESERAVRAQIRKETQERALSQLRDQKTREADRKLRMREEAKERIDFHALLPILIHVADLDFGSGTAVSAAASADPKKAANKSDTSNANSANGTVRLDPAEPLVKAMIRRLGVMTSRAAPPLLYNRLAAGTCLVLIDGLDEIGTDRWPQILAWLSEFMKQYGANFIIVTGPVVGFDPLVNVGFTPIYSRAWSDNDLETLVTRWSTAWSIIGGIKNRSAEIPDARLVQRVSTGNRGRTALDVSLRAWAAFANDERETGRRTGYDFYVRSVLGADDAQRATLAQIASAALDGDGTLTRDRVTVNGAGEWIDKMRAIDVLRESPNGALTLRLPQLGGYLAALTLTDATPERIAQVAMQPGWEVAFPFAVGYAPLDAAVRQRLSQPPDMLYSGLFGLAHWLVEAPPNVDWKGEVLRRFAGAFITPSQYPGLRDRAVAALITTRDPSVLAALRQAFSSSDIQIRRLACIGMGALGNAEAIKDLERGMSDRDNEVQLAAALAFGAIDNETALDRLVSGVMDGDELIRRAITETLAGIPSGGHDLLRELIRAREVLVRRATVFGLSRIRAPWALSILYRTMLEDSQWYVRSAAEQAFSSAEDPVGSGPVGHPGPEDLGWLVAWAATKGDSVPAGPGGTRTLVRALQEGDPLHRAAAALTIGYMGYVPGLKPLYEALRDPDETVRSTAHEGLITIQSRLGKPLPAV